jgi:hypothetical protein
VQRDVEERREKAEGVGKWRQALTVVVAAREVEALVLAVAHGRVGAPGHAAVVWQGARALRLVEEVAQVQHLIVVILCTHTWERGTGISAWIL